MEFLSNLWQHAWLICQNLFSSEELLRILSQPEFTVASFVVLTAVVFTETGLLVGFFLPGDSLLVLVGMVCAHPACEWRMTLLLVLLCAAAIIGDTVGYAIGYKTGPKIFNREKSLFFNKDHLIKAQKFYEKHGGKTIILARFMPIIRTFAPVVAGVGQMNYRRFLCYNIFGGIGWVCSMIYTGYLLPTLLNPPMRAFFGENFRIEKHIEKVIIVVVFLSILPGIVAWLRNRVKPVATPAPVTVECEARALRAG